MLELHGQYNFKIPGGCCGTNESIIESLSKKITCTLENKG